uniref:VWFC domain-containing protein n=1 Tax=Strigamia maritima TaxID=126957 RepID=T1J7S6_STRMM
MVGNKTYEDGESFTPDCRTQCTCQNGTYGCVSLCTRENLLPSTGCINPRLVPVAGKCCREWMCDTNVLSGPKCRQVMGEWSLCSVSCGVGVSVRLSNDNAECLLRNETRLCQVRPCDLRNVRMNHMTRHHIRKGHTCKATVRSSWPMRIRHGNCTSVRPLHLKFCGICGGDICCSPITSDTRMEEFDCGPSPSARLNLALMSIKRCQCSRCPHSSWHRDS